MRQNGIRPGRTRFATGGRAKARGGGVMRRDEMSGYRNMDMGLEGYYKKGGRVGCGKAKRGFGRAFKGGKK